MGPTCARIRQILITICLAIAFVLSLIIMGLVGAHGKVTTANFEQGCLLYMSITDGVASYNNGFCLFPIVGSAVIAFLTLIFLIYWIMMLHRRDEYAPKSMSVFFLALIGLCGLLAFAICGEIGIGLNRGCNILGDQSYNCRSRRNFNALYGAEVSAGLMGGFCMLAMALELLQLKNRPRLLGVIGVSSVDQLAQGVVPAVRHSQVGNSYNIAHGKSPVVASRSQKEEYGQPEMTSYPAHGGQYQQSYQPPPQTPQQQQQQYYQPQGQVHQPQAQTYQQPSQTYQQPAQTYQQPAQTYQQPVQTYQQPAQTYQQPEQAYQQTYNAPPPPPPAPVTTQTTETTTQVVETVPADVNAVGSTEYH